MVPKYSQLFGDFIFPTYFYVRSLKTYTHTPTQWMHRVLYVTLLPSEMSVAFVNERQKVKMDVFLSSITLLDSFHRRLLL